VSQATFSQGSKYLSMFSGQPKALPVLFFTELWERFGFYGMRALLVLYMTKELLIADTPAYGIYGSYMALVYLSPVFGGYIADYILGSRRSIMLGGIIMSIGYFTLSIPGLTPFYLGLGMIISGNGLFKANISSLLGKYYTPKDLRRDSGFTLFYIGVNIGALLAPFICGTVGEEYGWRYGFAFSGVGMLIGLFVFWFGKDWLLGYGEPPNEKKLLLNFSGISFQNWTILFSVLSVPVFSFFVIYNHILDFAMPAFGLVILGYLFYVAFSSGREERNNLLVILVLMFFFMTFFAFFEQAGGLINLFTDRNVDRVLWGYEIKTTWFQSLNPVFIIILGPPISWLWVYLARRNREPYTLMKFAIGIGLLGLGFFVMAYGALCECEAGKTSMLWLSLGYILQTAGELSIAPTGLSMVTKLAPVKMANFFMGVWFLSISFAEYIGVIIAKFASISPGETGAIDLAVCIRVYGEIFEKIGYVAIGIALFIVLISPIMRPVFRRVE
jgi:POT family proton-dependent oligopeptide transporter